MLSFVNRLRKNFQHFRKWARKRDISCYRLYERDIPEFPFVVDYYDGRVHLQSLSGDDEQLMAAREACALALDVSLDAVKCKKREGQKRDSQYEKTGDEGEYFEVSEGHCKFIVNLDAYLDTGLFLDHRNARRMIGEMAQGKRFLNLFSYTGSFTVHAAKGGAHSSVTVDLSNRYLDWARRNFELNGLDPARHVRVRADVLLFLKEAVAKKERFDLIVLDPPSFSNSRKMTDILDIQRDHVLLIEQCMTLLNPGGVLFFSTNLRSFKPDIALFTRLSAREISDTTVPDDFRNRRIHRAWLIAK